MRLKDVCITIGLCGSLVLHGLLMYVGLKLLIRQLDTECHLPPLAIARKPETKIMTTRPARDDAPPEIMVIRPRVRIMPVVIVPDRVPDTKLPANVRPDVDILPIVVVPKPTQLPPKPVSPREEVRPLIVIAPPPKPELKITPPEPLKPELPKPEPPKPRELAKVEPPPPVPKTPPKPVLPPPLPPKEELARIQPAPPPPPKLASAPPPPPKTAKLEEPAKPPDKTVPPPPPPPPPVAKAAPSPEPEDDEEDWPSEIDHFFGRQDGEGTAVNDAPGDQPQQARLGPQDQAALTRGREGMIRPIERVNDPEGKKLAGGGPAGGGGGATPSQAADSTAAWLGPGGIASGSNPKPQPAQAGELASPGSVAKPSDPGKPQSDVPTAPPPGMPFVRGGSGSEKKLPEPIGIAVGSGKDTIDDGPPGPSIAGGGAGTASDRPVGPDTAPRVGQVLPRPPQVAIAPNDLPPTPDALQQIGGGAIATLRPTTRPTPAALAAAIGPRDLPPGKRNPSPGPLGPGDGPGDGEAPSRSPIKEPAIRSDSESDAFSSIRADIFRMGKVEAKAGRKVRSVKPRIGDRAMTDLWTYGRLITVFKVSISKEGKVTNVEVRRASGSESIDLATRLAIYQWWIEPKKGPNGVAIPDSVTLTIVWH